MKLPMIIRRKAADLPERSADLPIDKHQCTGCGVCSAVCPEDNIRMEEMEAGFRYPVPDAAGDHAAAFSRCPVLHPVVLPRTEPRCYAVQAKEAVRLASASGGAAAVLTQHILQQGGYVCGAAFKDAVAAEHVILSDPAEASRLAGVKYTQSTISREVYARLQELLTAGKTVLFTGCPCQIAALYAYLGKDYPTLYTLEIVCRGVSSAYLVRQYLAERFPDKEPVSVAFRNKQKYGWSSSMTVQFSDGTQFREKCEPNLFYQLFQSDYAVRPSCTECRFTGIPRQGDLTSGDLWSVRRFHPEWSDGLGTSSLLVNSDKGAALFGQIRPMLALAEEIPLKEAIDGNRVLIERRPQSANTDRFHREVGRVPMQHLLQLCRDDRYDVGIVGLWYGLNYGSVLTYYALYRLLYDMGYEPLLIEKPDFLWTSRYADPATIAGRFIRPRCNVSVPRSNTEDWKLQGEQCDSYVIGSDVVWNYEICGKSSGSFLFLDFVAADKKKLAYAASFGGEYHAPEWLHQQHRYYLRQFDGVSVREDAAVDICRKQFGVHADKVLDPVFLCDMHWFEDAAQASALELPARYLMCYILGASVKKREFIRTAARRLGVEPHIVVNPNEPERCKEILELPVLHDPSVEDWLKLIRDCTLFIGDSFHGLCFSLLFHKRFVIIIRRDMPSRDRFVNLLRICGLEDRLLYMEQPNTDKLHLLEEDIDYEAVEQRLDAYRSPSLEWLRGHMEQRKHVSQITGGLEKRLSAMQYEIHALQRELDALKKK